MAKELIKVNEKWAVLRCVREMRKQAEEVDKVYTIYVVDDDDVLLGTLSLKKLLLTPEKTFITVIRLAALPAKSFFEANAAFICFRQG